MQLPGVIAEDEPAAPEPPPAAHRGASAEVQEADAEGSPSDGDGGSEAGYVPMSMKRTSTMAREKRRIISMVGSSEEDHLARHREERDLDQGTRKFLTTCISCSRFASQLTAEQLDAIVGSMSYFEFEPGVDVVREGQCGSHFFVLEQGVLQVSISGAIATELVAGNSFGDIALLHRCPRTATITATAPAGMWGVDGETFRKVIREWSARRLAENRRVLNRIRFLDGLTTAQKDRIGEIALVEERFRAGERVFAEGEATTSLYCVKSGQLSVIEGGVWTATGQLEGGKKKAKLVAGDSFGERAAMYNEPRSSSVVAETFSELICIRVSELKEVLGEDLAQFLQRNFLISVLKKIQHVTHLPQVQQGRLADAMAQKAYGPNKNIEEECVVMIVIDGAILAQDGVNDGKKDVMLRRGDLLLDSALKEKQDGPTPVGARTLRGALVAVLKKEGFAKIFRDSGVIGLGSSATDDEVLDHMRKSAVVRKVPLFSALSGAQINKLISSMSLSNYLRGASIVRQGEMGMALYVVAEGVVQLAIDGKFVRSLGPGASFGERSVLVQERRGASLQASSATAQLWSLDQKQFSAIVPLLMREELMRRLQLQERTNMQLRSFRHVRVVCAGSLGPTRLVEHRRMKMRYALKRARKENGAAPSEIERTHELLKDLDHPFIITLVVRIESERSVYLLTDIVTGGNLAMQLNRLSGVLTTKEVQFYIAALVLVLEYLHERGVVFRDLKPENVLLDSHGYPKLADFACAKKLDMASMRTYSLVGTPFYIAPEVVQGSGYSTSADIWSLGVLFYEIAIGRMPFGEGKEEEHEILVAILEENLRFPSQYADHMAKKLIQSMLAKRPARRIGVRGWDDIKGNRFFRGVSGDLFSRIAGREVEPPVTPAGEEFLPEAELLASASLSDEEDLGGMEDDLAAHAVNVFTKVKFRGGAKLTKQQLARALRVLDATKFSDDAMDRIWTAIGAEDKVQLDDFVSWMSARGGDVLSAGRPRVPA